jgi:hypothetical protein
MKHSTHVIFYKVNLPAKIQTLSVDDECFLDDFFSELHKTMPSVSDAAVNNILAYAKSQIL